MTKSGATPSTTDHRRVAHGLPRRLWLLARLSVAILVSLILFGQPPAQAQVPPADSTDAQETPTVTVSASTPTVSESWLDCGGANPRGLNDEGRCPYQGSHRASSYSHTICSGPWTYELNTPYKSGHDQGGTAGAAMTGTQITVDTSWAKPPAGEHTTIKIQYLVTGTYDIWWNDSIGGGLRIIGQDAACSVTKSTTIRVNGPSQSTADRALIKRTSSDTVCGEGGCIDPDVGAIPTATQMQQRGDYVPPDSSRCTVVSTADGGTMSWCGTLTNADGVAIAPNDVPLSEFTNVRTY